ncbi:MAG: NUDIX hydrolase [Sedimenticola sp.]|jgi:ADP-ribose pyrophosphatase YjhB (NUDIX family)|nr:MAG: NUDIX hydrolase [Sedimenticola sp.]
MTWYPHATVAAIIEQDNRFLMVKEKPSDGEIVYNQPAGHLDEGEGLIQAVIRETREETAWRFTPEGLVGVYRWQVPPNGATYLRFCFHGRVDDHQPELDLDTEIIEAVWMSLDELEAMQDQLRSPMVLRCIRDFRAGQQAPLHILTDLS